MDPFDRPKLPPTVYRAIESAQIKINNYYWMSLLDFQVSIAAANRLVSPDLKAEPPKAKRPDALRAAIARYARDLFAAEASQYPTDDGLERFLLLLAERTVEQVGDTIASVEESGRTPFRRVSLAYHGLSMEEMRETAANEISSLIAGRMAQIHAAAHPPASVKDKEETTASPETPNVATSEVERRKKLLADYKTATGAKDYHIFTSTNSGIHKPEFYQWRDGRLPAKSKVTKRFETFLKAKRRPIRKNPTN